MEDLAGGGAEEKFLVMGEAPASHHHDAAAQLGLFLQDGVANGCATPDNDTAFNLRVLQAGAQKNFLVNRQALSMVVF